jgi:hypothetical protein
MESFRVDSVEPLQRREQITVIDLGKLRGRCEYDVKSVIACRECTIQPMVELAELRRSTAVCCRDERVDDSMEIAAFIVR